MDVGRGCSWLGKLQKCGLILGCGKVEQQKGNQGPFYHCFAILSHVTCGKRKKDGLWVGIVKKCDSSHRPPFAILYDKRCPWPEFSVLLKRADWRTCHSDPASNTIEKGYVERHCRKEGFKIWFFKRRRDQEKTEETLEVREKDYESAGEDRRTKIVGRNIWYFTDFWSFEYAILLSINILRS